MKRISEIKQNAKQALKGKWIFTIFAEIVPTLICLLCLAGITRILYLIPTIDSNMQPFILNITYINIIPKIVFILSIYITPAINMWLINFFHTIYYYKDGKTELIDGFSIKYTKVYLLYLINNFTVLLTFVLSIFVDLHFMFPKIELFNVLFIVFGVIYLVALIPQLVISILFAFPYAMTYYILIESPEMSVIECMKESRKIMKGNKLRYLCLNLSFIGWILLSIVTLGFGFFYTAPYMSTAQVAFYDDIK